jgi:hypothetical protein
MSLITPEIKVALKNLPEDLNDECIMAIKKKGTINTTTITKGINWVMLTATKLPVTGT